VCVGGEGGGGVVARTIFFHCLMVVIPLQAVANSLSELMAIKRALSLSFFLFFLSPFVFSRPRTARGVFLWDAQIGGGGGRLDIYQHVVESLFTELSIPLPAVICKYSRALAAVTRAFAPTSGRFSVGPRVNISCLYSALSLPQWLTGSKIHK